MQMIYDSESYAVMHLNAAPFDKPFINLADPPPVLTDHDPFAGRLERHGFEIVDKRSGKEVYLDGSWAEMFQEKLNAWQRKMPTTDEIEQTLDSYAALATQPVLMH